MLGKVSRSVRRSVSKSVVKVFLEGKKVSQVQVPGT